ncbi:hypothetical protein ACH5RR_021245 [Cinchona calisaya]|uniref:Uncharacterized protein n=1 Tax=Cinchona calisaya TaxID=153742 RepID=A0ABD2ZGR7_9GENT
MNASKDIIKGSVERKHQKEKPNSQASKNFEGLIWQPKKPIAGTTLSTPHALLASATNILVVQIDSFATTNPVTKVNLIKQEKLLNDSSTIEPLQSLAVTPSLCIVTVHSSNNLNATDENLVVSLEVLPDNAEFLHVVHDDHHAKFRCSKKKKPLLPYHILYSLSDSDSVSHLDLLCEVLIDELHEVITNLKIKGIGTCSSEAPK